MTANDRAIQIREHALRQADICRKANDDVLVRCWMSLTGAANDLSPELPWHNGNQT